MEIADQNVNIQKEEEVLPNRFEVLANLIRMNGGKVTVSASQAIIAELYAITPDLECIQKEAMQKVLEISA